MIIGLDPGTRLAGYAVVKEHPVRTDELELVEAGVWKLDTKKSHEERCHDLTTKTYDLLQKHKPEKVGVETPFAARNIQVTIKLSRAGGAIYSACGKAKVPVIVWVCALSKLTVLAVPVVIDKL